MKNTLTEIIGILRQTQGGLRESIKTQIKPHHVGNGYMIYTHDSRPKPMLCVHLDTINTHAEKCKIKPDRDYEYDENLNILGLSKESPLHCLGGDDRAGVWIALKIISYMEETGNYKYDVGFFEDEEIGCKGSSLFNIDVDMFELNTTCYIGLDRKSTNGVQELALYGDDNKDLIEIFTDLGYPTDMGSITDASNLSGKVACVNLSIGYDHEHTKKEVLHINCMEDTLNTLKIARFRPLPYEADFDFYFDTNPWSARYVMEMDTPDWCIEELEEENEILKACLKSMNVDVEALLQKAKTYDF